MRSDKTSERWRETSISEEPRRKHNGIAQVGFELNTRLTNTQVKFGNVILFVLIALRAAYRLLTLT